MKIVGEFCLSPLNQILNMKICCEEVTSDPLLLRCHAASVTYNGRVYLHGGLASLKQSGQPLSSLVCWDPEDNTVTKVETGSEAVTRSHHTANLSGEVSVVMNHYSTT